MNKTISELSEEDVFILGIIYQLSGKGREKTKVKGVPGIGGSKTTIAAIAQKYKAAHPSDKRQLDSLKSYINLRLKKLLAPHAYIKIEDREAGVGNNIATNYRNEYTVTDEGVKKLKALTAPLIQDKKNRSKQDSIKPFGYSMLQAIDSFNQDDNTKAISLSTTIEPDYSGITARYRTLNPHDIRDRDDIEKDTRLELDALNKTSFIEKEISPRKMDRHKTNIGGIFLLTSSGEEKLNELRKRPPQYEASSSKELEEHINKTFSKDLCFAFLKAVARPKQPTEKRHHVTRALAAFQKDNTINDVPDRDALNQIFDILVSKNLIEKADTEKPTREDVFQISASGQETLKDPTASLTVTIQVQQRANG